MTNILTEISGFLCNILVITLQTYETYLRIAVCCRLFCIFVYINQLNSNKNGQR